jgi:hypothetical protein
MLRSCACRSRSHALADLSFVADVRVDGVDLLAILEYRPFHVGGREFGNRRGVHTYDVVDRCARVEVCQRFPVVLDDAFDLLDFHDWLAP